jgi:glycosyltransferase involved in cell wall biosynthesis
MAHHPLMVSWRALKTRALLPSRLWYATRAIAQSGLFERKWYLSNNPDVAAEGIDPIRHYVLYGAKERRDPSPTFSTRGYLSRNPDVAAAGANPLEHFIRYGAKEGRLREASTSPAAQAAEQVVLPSLSVPARSASGLTPASEGDLHEQDRLTERYCSDEVFDADHQLLRESGLFDLNNYRKSAGIGADIDAIEHYLAKGWQTGLEPSPDFQGELLYSYFRSAGYFGPPAITYLKLRSAGGAAYTSLADAEYWAGPIRHSNMFNAAEYVARFGKIDGLDPALHYVIVGEQLGLAPSDAFDPTYYRARYPDVAQPTISPLGHYLKSGFQEGRRPMSIATKLTFDRSGLDERRETILLISHDASRTGAPILVWNIAKELRQRYNIVALLLRDGELVPDFGDCCAAVVGPLSHADWHPVDAGYIVRRLLASYSIAYAIANSTESTLFVPALTSAFVPVVSLIHEFVSYTRPKRAVSDGLDLSTQIVFSADVTARSAVTEYPHLSNRKIHVLPQGQCQVPRGAAKAASPDARTLREVFRPKGYEDALVVLGAGFVHIRKGVDLFLSCAAAVAALPTKRPVRFVWIGSGYDLENDLTYSTYLGEQIARSGLEGSVTIIDAIQELEPAYMMTDVFFLSSRLDPLPNVTIDAAFHGLPVVCFESASGMATLLAAEAPLRSCVVPHLDVQAAARVIVELANDETARKGIGDAMRKFAAATFDMVSYVGQLDRLGREAIDIMRQREQDFITLRDDPLFDKDVFLAPASLVTSRDEAIRQFLAVWAAVGNCHISATKSNFRRPCAGFHPQIYAQENLGRYDTAMVNPFAHFIRSGRPSGPWWHEVLSPSGKELVKATELRTALHVHFYYPELVSEFLRKLRCNQSRCDLLLSTDTEAKAKALHSATDGYGGGEVLIRVVPNRGRDIGPFLEFLAEVVDRYDIIGHIHSKRSPIVGDSWRKFLWGNLVGDPHPMMDIILQHFSADARLGMVFPDDPHLSDWDLNREIAERLTKRMGMKEQLPAFFDFPIGTMFWARTEALTPLLDLELGWDDYPDEPVPYDGTILHALERLLPFVARQAGYRYATTNVSGLTR